jgi:hypothetical protein
MLNTTSTEVIDSIHNTQNITKQHDLLSESVTYFQDIYCRSIKLLSQQQCCHTEGQAKNKNYPSCPRLAAKAQCQTANSLKHVGKRSLWGSSSALRSALESGLLSVGCIVLRSDSRP